MASSALNSDLAGPVGASPLILAPSLGTSVSMWDLNMPELRRWFRLIRYDHRGQGASPVPPGPYEIEQLGGDVLALLDRLEIESASYCGVSLGGMVGMWVAANAPERIDRLVLICTAAHLPPASRWADRARKVRAAGTTAVVADAVVDGWLTPRFAHEHPQVRAWLHAMLEHSPAEGYAACCGAIERLDLRDALGRITAPTLVIAGADDLAAPPERSRSIADSIRDARLEVLADAGHIANVEQPAAVNHLIIGHCA